jgi:Xaa-Pro aminopeptidase
VTNLAYHPNAAAAARDRLIEQLEPGDVALVPAATEQVRNNDVHYRFRQDSNFFYLTAFDEPDALAVIERHERETTYTLFVRPKDPLREVWDGFRAGIDGATKTYGAGAAHSVAEIDERLPQIIDGAKRLVYPVDLPGFETRVAGWRAHLRKKVRLGAQVPTLTLDLRGLVHELRAIKSDHEVALMAEAARISCEAHKRGMVIGTPGSQENRLEGVIEGHFRAEGAQRFAYPSIVASGANGCVLHYTSNDGRLGDDDLLLVDAGAEYCGYAADVTTTWPASGRFSPAQRKVYEAVLDVQRTVVAAVRPGATFNELNELANRHLTVAMVELGLLPSDEPIDALLERKAHRAYYMHTIGHWLGMDVHDVGSYGSDRQRPFQAGMALTVEPGIYIAPGSAAPLELQGIAVRIEDDLVVTEDGHRNLTVDVPRSVDEIEAYIAAERAR